MKQEINVKNLLFGHKKTSEKTQLRIFAIFLK